MHGPHGHQRHEENGQPDHQEASIRMLAGEQHSDRPKEEGRRELNGDAGVGCGEQEIDHVGANV